MKKSYKIAGIALFLILTSCGTEPEVNQTSAVESNPTQPDNSISDYGTSDGLLNILAESDPANDKLDFESLLGIKSSRTVELIPLEKPEDITIENTLENREVQNVETV